MVEINQNQRQSRNQDAAYRSSTTSVQSVPQRYSSLSSSGRRPLSSGSSSSYASSTQSRLPREYIPTHQRSKRRSFPPVNTNRGEDGTTIAPETSSRQDPADDSITSIVSPGAAVVSSRGYQHSTENSTAEMIAEDDVITPLRFHPTSLRTGRGSRLNCFGDDRSRYAFSSTSRTPVRPPPPPYGVGSDRSRRPRKLYPTGSSPGRVKPSLQNPNLDKGLKRNQSTTSNKSVSSGFAPHPAVRPFTNNNVMGEAAFEKSAGTLNNDDAANLKPLESTLIVIGICLAVFIISLDRSMITTAIPEITAQFHSYEDIGWYGSAYLLTASAFQPLYGRIYMSFEIKVSFLAALAIFELGSLISALTPSSTVLIIARAIQGLGSAGVLTGSYVVGTHSVRLQKRPVLFAAVGILYGVGALCGPLLGGVFTDTIGWRWCFWINLPVGAVTFLTVCFCFKHRIQTTNEITPNWLDRVLSLDLIGNVILLGACTMLFLALQYSETKYAWNSRRVIGLLVGFGLTTILFIIRMRDRGETALIPPRIIRQRTVVAACGAGFFIYGALLLHAYYLPIWFQAIKGTSALHSGINMIPYMLANALFSLLAGIFVSRNGPFAPPAILGCAIGTVGCGLLATIKPTTSTSMWIGYEILASAGMGMAIQQGLSAVQTALPLEDVPIGTAAVVASQSLGGAIFVSVGNSLLQNHLLGQNNAKAVPGVNIRSVVALGATMFRETVPHSALPALIQLYNKSLRDVFIAAIPLCGCAFLCSLFMEFRSLQGKQDDTGKRFSEHKGKSIRAGEGSEKV